ncbi:hypothetical protein QQP08_004875 [Theobroma cacao]|nr:hypothetical protein QQP08_004875 [Theobroma cacao]
MVGCSGCLQVSASAPPLYVDIIVSILPSFAKKLNPEGFTPIHLAMENGHEDLALHPIHLCTVQ